MPLRSTSQELRGRRVVLRGIKSSDFAQWSEVRRHNEKWLTRWEPKRLPGYPDVSRDATAFASRCTSRERERQHGAGYGFGVFVAGSFCGEVNVASVQRGALQGAVVGYWIDERMAGHGYIPEAVVLALEFAFTKLALHRIEIAIIPRNTNSRRVVEKLGIRMEGLAERFLEINGVWEDHYRYAITSEEWKERSSELSLWIR